IVVHEVCALRVEQRGVHVDPDRRMLLAEVLRQLRIRHQMEPHELHGGLAGAVRMRLKTIALATGGHHSMPCLSALRGGEKSRRAAPVPQLLDVRERSRGAWVTLQLRLDGSRNIEKELVLPRGTAELQSERRAGGFEAARDRDRGVRW